VEDGGFAISTANCNGNSLVNICDEDLLGKVVSEGELKVHLSRDYYLGEIVTKGEALRLIRTCNIVNLAGRNVVSLALENKIGAREAVREIDGVPFLMIYKFLR
jgi:uncharacterized protein